MLVLSRRLNEKVVFPGINTSIQVVSVKQGLVRLGIDAPSEVAVFREEVLARDPGPKQPGRGPEEATVLTRLRELNHLLRNRLNTTGVGLSLLRRQLQAGLIQGAQQTLQTVEQEFRALRERAEQAVEQVTAPPPPKASRPRKALLVEDDQNERELMAGLLRMAGLEVATAGDGVDALDYLRKQGRPDVMLLDMMLPRCDGPTMLRQVRHDPAYAGMKIFAMSGHTPERFGLDQGEAGFDRWFRKPVNPEVILHDLTEELAAER